MGLKEDEESEDEDRSTCTVFVLRMAHRIWKETKLQPGTAGTGNMLGCCLVSFHFLWTILSTSTVKFVGVASFPVQC